MILEVPREHIEQILAGEEQENSLIVQQKVYTAHEHQKRRFV
jgi:hypothetical protein